MVWYTLFHCTVLQHVRIYVDMLRNDENHALQLSQLTLLCYTRSGMYTAFTPLSPLHHVHRPEVTTYLTDTILAASDATLDLAAPSRHLARSDCSSKSACRCLGPAPAGHSVAEPGACWLACIVMITSNGDAAD
jgi:hypothetical protein